MQGVADDSLRHSVLVERGLLMYRKGTLAEAAAVLEEAKKQWPERVPACTALALVYAKQEKRVAAISLLGEALQRARTIRASIEAEPACTRRNGTGPRP